MVHAFELPRNHHVAYFQHVAAHLPDAAPRETVQSFESPPQRKTIEERQKRSQSLPDLAKTPGFRKHQAERHPQPEKHSDAVTLRAQATNRHATRK
jgi:hypothetical protein